MSAPLAMLIESDALKSCEIACVECSAESLVRRRTSAMRTENSSATCEVTPSYDVIILNTLHSVAAA